MLNNEVEYPICIKNQGIFIVPIKNFRLHKLVYKYIETTQGNYSHGPKIVPTSYRLKRFIVVELNIWVPICLTTWIPSQYNYY
jgi:hypothetical protein